MHPASAKHQVAASTSSAPVALPAPPDYFPPANGRYEVKPGMHLLGKDLGGGAADALVFQVDQPHQAHLSAKLAARRQSPETCRLTHDLRAETQRAVLQWMTRQLIAEHPAHFDWRPDAGGHRDPAVRSADGCEAAGGAFHCQLTGQSLRLDADMTLLDQPAGDKPAPPFADAFDALACQVQEDLAIVQRDGDRDWLAALHVCLPSRWAPEEKIGQPFASVHQPVAGMTAMNRRAPAMVELMVGAATPLVRFTWGLSTDASLDHHPSRSSPPPFNPGAPQVWLRVERQVIVGFPQVDAALFIIRTCLTDLREIRQDPSRRQALAAAVRSMSPESLAYKGMTGWREALLRWL